MQGTAYYNASPDPFPIADIASEANYITENIQIGVCAVISFSHTKPYYLKNGWINSVI